MRILTAGRGLLGIGSQVLVPGKRIRRVVGTMDVVMVESKRVVVVTSGGLSSSRSL